METSVAVTCLSDNIVDQTRLQIAWRRCSTTGKVLSEEGASLTGHVWETEHFCRDVFGSCSTTNVLVCGWQSCCYYWMQCWLNNSVLLLSFKVSTVAIPPGVFVILDRVVNKHINIMCCFAVMLLCCSQMLRKSCWLWRRHRNNRLSMPTLSWHCARNWMQPKKEEKR